MVVNNRTKKLRKTRKTEKALPLGLLMQVIPGLIQDAAFKDFINRILDEGKVFLDQFVVRLDSLEKRMSTMEHSLELMIKARQKLGHLEKDSKGDLVLCGNDEED